MPIIKLVTLVLGCYQICSDDKIADINKRVLQLRTTALNVDLMSLFELPSDLLLLLLLFYHYHQIALDSGGYVSRILEVQQLIKVRFSSRSGHLFSMRQYSMLQLSHTSATL